MNLLNATKLHKITGASFALIRKLVSLGILTPVNSSEPYMFDEDAVDKIKEYQDNSKSKNTVVPLYPLLKSLSDQIEAISKKLDSMEGVLNQTQMLQALLQQSQTIQLPKGQFKKSKKSQEELEHEEELRVRLKELSKGKTVALGGNDKIIFYRYDMLKEMAAIKDELNETETPEIQNTFDDFEKEFSRLFEEYKAIKDGPQEDSSLVKLSQFMDTTMTPAVDRWKKFIVGTFNLPKQNTRTLSYIYKHYLSDDFDNYSWGQGLIDMENYGHNHNP